MNSDRILRFAKAFAMAASPRAEYMKEYMRKRYKEKREWALNQLGNKCVECGDKKGPFDLDHIDSSKKEFRSADIHSVSDKKLKKNLKNLQILCVPCHKEKTQKAWDRGVSKPNHGTYWMYRKHGCRCDKCSEAYKTKQKEWRDNRKES